MNNVNIVYRPLTQWPTGRARTSAGDHEDARFKSTGKYESNGGGGSSWKPGKRTPLSQTLEDLDRELWQIGVIHAVVQVDIENDRNFRQDGGIRADARVRTPAVVLSFKRDGVPLAFATDRFKRWEDNLRAIALGLEGLRRLERYHIGQSGDQYRGWQALPASTTPALSIEQAAAVIARRTGDVWSPADVMRDHEIAKRACRAAASKSHPDNGGSTSDFQLVQEAKRILEAHFGGTL